MENVHLFLGAKEQHSTGICLGKESAGALLTGDLAVVDQAE